MKYTHYIQERSYWCVPACLESILESKGVLTTQQDIAEKLNITQDGLEQLDKNTINKFLEEYNLNCRFSSYFLGDLEPDSWLNEELKENNVLVAYNYQKLHNSEGYNNHVSIVVKYNIQNDKVTLLDPSKEEQVTVPLYGPDKSLVNCMQSKENMKYGFYIISQLLV